MFKITGIGAGRRQVGQGKHQETQLKLTEGETAQGEANESDKIKQEVTSDTETDFADAGKTKRKQ